MKKIIFALIAVIAVFCSVSPAHAQLPFPGQSIPQLYDFDQFNFDNYTDIHMITRGTSSSPYWLYDDQRLYKHFSNVDILVKVIEQTYHQYDGSINTDRVFKVIYNDANPFGFGDYISVVNRYAYNPNTGVKIFMWSQECHFSR